MSPQRRAPRRKKKIGRRRFLAGLGCAAGAYFLYRSVRNVEKIDPPAALQTDETPNPALPSGEWRAVWVSYLEWARMNFSSEAAFRADIAALMDNCAALGLNTVLAQVRPFGDALYESSQRMNSSSFSIRDFPSDTILSKLLLHFILFIRIVRSNIATD